MENVEERIVRIICKVREEIKKDEIKSETDVFKDLEFDSLDIMLFVNELEAEFELKFGDLTGLVDSIGKVENIVKYISSLIENIN